ncbi:MAG: hypothetical protein R2780_09825 [Crocinitomicaceae bacterium]|nr:hypothetical protein [Crocinitomicaceae bacterium]
MQEQMKVIHHEHGQTTLKLRADGIVEVLGAGMNYDLEATKEIHQAIKTLTANKPSPILINTEKFTLVDAETREYLSTDEANAHATSKAFVISSLPQKLLLNFLIKFQKPNCPTRFFADKDSAIQWLYELKENDQK